MEDPFDDFEVVSSVEIGEGLFGAQIRAKRVLVPLEGILEVVIVNPHDPEDDAAYGRRRELIGDITKDYLRKRVLLPRNMETHFQPLDNPSIRTLHELGERYPHAKTRVEVLLAGKPFTYAFALRVFSKDTSFVDEMEKRRLPYEVTTMRDGVLDLPIYVARESGLVPPTG